MAKIYLYAGAAETKAELRQMLTEAVRNTQPSAENGSKRPTAKSDRG